MNSISLFGVDLPDSYQLGYILGYNAQVWFARLRLNLGLVCYNVATGDFLFADDMPVKIKPGFLLQGKRDKFGDTNVFHGSAEGNVVPHEVLTIMELAMPTQPDTRNTCFRCINDANPLKDRTYGVGLTTYVTANYSVLNHTWDSFYGVGGAETVGSFESKTYPGNVTVLHWSVENALYLMDLTVTVTGNLRHRKLSSADKSPNYLDGHRELSVTTKKTGSTLHSNLTVSTGLNFVPWSKPQSLASVTSEMVLASLGEDGAGTINGDLIDLDGISLGNAPWTSCFYAVNSMKYIQLQWLEFIRDSYHWKQLIPPLKRLSQLKNPAVWGEIFLWFSYGVRPTIGDVGLIADIAIQNGDRPLSELAKEFASRHVQYGTAYDTDQTFLDLPVSGKCNARVTLQTMIRPESMLGQLFLVLQSVGLGIDARNLWELIPYSFVVDWFVNTADMAKWIDSLGFPCSYDILQCVLSEKRTCVLPANRYYGSTDGQVVLTSYKRVVSTTVPVQPFEVRFTDPSGHWLEAAALLITRR